VESSSRSTQPIDISAGAGGQGLAGAVLESENIYDVPTPTPPIWGFIGEFPRLTFDAVGLVGGPFSLNCRRNDPGDRTASAL
jgi:hypothetical protein